MRRFRCVHANQWLLWSHNRYNLFPFLLLFLPFCYFLHFSWEIPPPFPSNSNREPSQGYSGASEIDIYSPSLSLSLLFFMFLTPPPFFLPSPSSLFLYNIIGDSQVTGYVGAIEIDDYSYETQNLPLVGGGWTKPALGTFSFPSSLFSHFYITYTKTYWWKPSSLFPLSFPSFPKPYSLLFQFGTAKLGGAQMMFSRPCPSPLSLLPPNLTLFVFVQTILSLPNWEVLIKWFSNIFSRQRSCQVLPCQSRARSHRFSFLKSMSFLNLNFVCFLF